MPVYRQLTDHNARGIGEPGLPVLVSTLTNAIFDLTSQRRRKLRFDIKAV